MSGDAIIEARHLCKEFVVGGHHGTLKGRVTRRGRGAPRERKRALDDLCLEILAGESVALVGDNGSGKSTFLSLIGRIYRPTSGEIRVRRGARVAPLLELGAGFHHELTGEENIRLNGVILGLTRREVEQRRDAIVEFSGIAAKMPEPVRSYSSGELIRLGFAVASHTDADILLVDEAFAAADAWFQEKCYRRLADFTRQGRTILFVAHDERAVARVARRAVWLDRGRLRADGPVEEVQAAYAAERQES